MTNRRLDPQRAPWLASAEVHALFEALGAENARVVGGAVRDALLGRPAPRELDIACRWPPEESIRRLTAAGFRTIPSGLSHGTISVPGREWFYEITTLRIDVETDGRHARVAFTDDWRADAARRDFTMNAIYCDLEGQLVDFFGGIEDACGHRVRFIGDPRQRIEEDALRILRFFRFHAHYGRGHPDKKGLAACAAMRDRLAGLSIERVRDEILGLLAAPDPRGALAAMEEVGILRLVLPHRADDGVARTERLVMIERIFADAGALGEETMDACALRRLAALLVPLDGEELRAEARRLRLSRRQARRLAHLARPLDAHDERSLRRAIHADGIEPARDRLLLSLTRADANDRAAASIACRWRELAAAPPPDFPIRGADLLALGVAPGPRIGRLLEQLKEEWAQEDFRLSRSELLARARTGLANEEAAQAEAEGER